MFPGGDLVGLVASAIDVTTWVACRRRGAQHDTKRNHMLSMGGFVPHSSLPVVHLHDVFDDDQTGCAFLTYQTREAGERAVEKFHNKVKLPNVSSKAPIPAVSVLVSFWFDFRALYGL